MNYEIKRLLNSYRLINPNELTDSQLDHLEHELTYPILYDFPSNNLLDFQFWTFNYPSRQESFAEYISHTLNNYKDKNILEVGCGRTAKSSIILCGKGFKHITCIDPLLEFEGNEYITCIKDMFDYRTFDVSKFDCVIAQEPNSATEHIIRACLRNNVHFIISLPTYPQILISGQFTSKTSKWYKYLLTICDGRARIVREHLNPLLEVPIMKSINFFNRKH